MLLGMVQGESMIGNSRHPALSRSTTEVGHHNQVFDLHSDLAAPLAKGSRTWAPRGVRIGDRAPDCETWHPNRSVPLPGRSKTRLSVQNIAQQQRRPSPGAASKPPRGPFITVRVWFQLDPQALQDRDWQRTVIDMNGVSAHRALCVSVCHRKLKQTQFHPEQS